MATAVAQASTYSALSVPGHQSHTAESPAFPGARLSLKQTCIHAADGRLTVTRSALSPPTHAATAVAHAQCGLQMCPTAAGHTMRCRSAYPNPLRNMLSPSRHTSHCGVCVLQIISKAGHTPLVAYAIVDTRTETAPDEKVVSGAGSTLAAAAGVGVRARARMTDASRRCRASR